MNKKKKISIIIFSFVICVLMFIGAVKGNDIFTASNAAKVDNLQDINKESIENLDTDNPNEQQESTEEKENNNDKEYQKNKEDENTQINSDEKNQQNEININKSSTEEKSPSTKGENNESKENKSSITQENKNIKIKENEAPKNVSNSPWDNLTEGTILFYDTVNNKTILQSKCDYDGVNVAKITKTLLNKSGISYECTGVSDATTYFAMIAGLREKEAGSLSGWCYYVKRKGTNNFIKPNVSTGQFTFNKGDIVVWKYLGDGVNN